LREEEVSFESAGLSLSAVLQYPDDFVPGSSQRPAFIVLHGFGSNRNAGNVVDPARMLCDWGYVVLRFDMRGCGDSEGRFGHIICLEQVEDTQAAMDFLLARSDIADGRVALLGSSFGAAVALYTAGVDARAAAVVSSGGWGHGERKFRGQHDTPEAWQKFVDLLAAGRARQSPDDEPTMVSRYDIVPIPQHLRGRLSAKSVMEFPVETAQSMFDFRAEDVVAQIAPRPLLLMHAANDSVTPTEQSIELFKRAGEPTELHLLTDVDHFLLAEPSHRARAIVRDWLDRYYPV
jgi:pimeloyl-ACP methyl ester carboxylesterase